MTLWFGDRSPADARLHQRPRQRIDFSAHFKRKGGRWLAVIGTAIGAGVTAIEAWSITLAKACASAH
ncbi:hypothetical protein [Bradyrhizobium sp. 192]|uniref:hypothetical protein n=1 Tax=Bradyrhizobium sp. 192 TaxID=2782660 RepID=UPI001FFE4A53|nr:hypothetical protein [Bradyrhizobium sp. 192]UPJ59819.1 hypothetical protein IVB24_08725 [Bradyrhizobium sp. 192]